MLMSTVSPLKANVFPVPTKFITFALLEITVPSDLTPIIPVTALNALYATASRMSPLEAPPPNTLNVDPSVGSADDHFPQSFLHH